MFPGLLALHFAVRYIRVIFPVRGALRSLHSSSFASGVEPVAVGNLYVSRISREENFLLVSNCTLCP